MYFFNLRGFLFGLGVRGYGLLNFVFRVFLFKVDFVILDIEFNIGMDLDFEVVNISVGF